MRNYKFNRIIWNKKIYFKFYIILNKDISYMKYLYA